MNINRQEIIKSAAIVGPALAIAGYILYSKEQVWKWYTIALIALGGVMFLTSIAFNFRLIIEFFQGRQGKLSANTAVLSVAIIVLIGLLNYLGFRYHKRFDLTTEGLYTLSDQTRKIVGNLQKDVKVIKFDKIDDQQLADRMAEFKYLSSRISYERIDPLQKPEMARQYAVRTFGETIVAVGDRVERPQTADEQALVNAIMKVTRDKLKRVCFTTGHDEKSLSSTEGYGYAAVENNLKNENYEVKPVNLATLTQVPAECDVLVSAGPKKSFLPQESVMIGKYLDDGGKMFMLVDPEADPQLGDVLRVWNISLNNDLVVDRSGARIVGTGIVAPVVETYGEHPITKDLKRISTFFPEARTVKPADSSKGDGVVLTEILKTSENSWGETDLKSNPNEERQLDEGKDTKGPLSIGVSATRKVGEKESRLVVIGDSDFAINGFFPQAGNGSLFMNTVNWLAQDEDLISIRPKSATSRSLIMTEAQRELFWWLARVFMPLAAMGMGAYIWWKRR